MTQPAVYRLGANGWSSVRSPIIPAAPLHMDDFRSNQLLNVSSGGDREVWAIGTYFTRSDEGNLTLIERFCPPS